MIQPKINFPLGHAEIAELLLSNGANVNAVTQFYRTPLHWFVVNMLILTVVVL